MNVHHDEGMPTHIDREPCAGIREDFGEASIGEHAGHPLSRMITRYNTHPAIRVLDHSRRNASASGSLGKGVRKGRISAYLLVTLPLPFVL